MKICFVKPVSKNADAGKAFQQLIFKVSVIHLNVLVIHTDHLGSTSVITNQSGGVVERTSYSPYGEILSGGDTARYDYEGKELSPVTEDYDFHFRKYDPVNGRFSQPDAVIPNVYDPQSLNRYAFERNNPYKYVDENGKWWQLAVAAGIVGYAVISGFLQVHFYREAVASGQDTYDPDKMRANFVGGFNQGLISAGTAVIAGALIVSGAPIMGGAVGIVGGVTASMNSKSLTNSLTGVNPSQNTYSSGVIGGTTAIAGMFLPPGGTNSLQFFLNQFAGDYTSGTLNFFWESTSNNKQSDVQVDLNKQQSEKQNNNKIYLNSKPTQTNSNEGVFSKIKNFFKEIFGKK